MSNHRSPLSGFFARLLVFLWWAFIIGFIILAFISMAKSRF